MTIYLTEGDREHYLQTLTEIPPDEGAMPFIHKLNVIPGVCTVACCLGYHGPWPFSGEGVFTTGFMAMHLDKVAAKALEHAANSDVRNFCGGYASRLMKEWRFSVWGSPLRPVVHHTVFFSGRMHQICLTNLADMLERQVG